MSPSRPASPANSLLQQSGHCNSARTECRPRRHALERAGCSSGPGVPHPVAEARGQDPEVSAQGRRQFPELQRNQATNPPDVTRWCPHATRGHDTQVPITRSASARDLCSGDKHKAASPRYGPNLTERWGPRSRRSCQRPHTELIAILPGRELTLAHAHSEL